MLHNKAIAVNSTTPDVICIVLNKQHWSHKCGCQYIQHNRLFTLTTNCDGGTLLTTQHTHFCLILCLILHGGLVASVSPNIRRDMLPWSIGGVTRGPMVGRNQYGYITPAFSGSPWRGEINMATSPLPSRGPHGGEKSIRLHHPCLLGLPIVGRDQPSKEWMWWKRAKNG